MLLIGLNRKKAGIMKNNIRTTNVRNVFYWTPRILSILLISFLAIFAFDVFIPGQTVMYYVVALIIHLIPNFVLLGLLLLSWKYEKVGGILFLILGICFTLLFNTYKTPLTFMVTSLPIFLIGGLFLTHDHFYVKRIS
jgi:hypothetical protein